ncbi:MAG: GAP family protein [Syntrophothermus sp.]
MSDLASIFALGLVAMFNPTLLAAVTVMMLLPNTKRLMFGYLMGAYLTSLVAGMVIVYSLHGSGAAETGKQTLSPAGDLAVGAILLIAGLVLRSERAQSARERRKVRKGAEDGGEKKQSWPERMLGRGSARITFVVGALLTFPGVAYLTALDRITQLDWAAGPTALLVIGFCLMQQILLELPLIGYVVAPDWTQDAVVRFRAWLGRNGEAALRSVLLVLGALLVVRGLIELLT